MLEQSRAGVNRPRHEIRIHASHPVFAGRIYGRQIHGKTLPARFGHSLPLRRRVAPGHLMRRKLKFLMLAYASKVVHQAQGPRQVGYNHIIGTGENTHGEET